MKVLVINAGSSSLKYQLIDTDTDTLFCLRDQFGTKPFYYYLTDDGKLLFGTTIREIMSQDGFKKELNQDDVKVIMTGGVSKIYKNLVNDYIYDENLLLEGLNEIYKKLNK